MSGLRTSLAELRPNKPLDEQAHPLPLIGPTAGPPYEVSSLGPAVATNVWTEREHTRYRLTEPLAVVGVRPLDVVCVVLRDARQTGRYDGRP